MTNFTAPIAEQIWDMKYRFTGNGDLPADETIHDTWRRVARDLAQAEDDPEKWDPVFYSALEDFKFLPAGRIISGAGTGRAVTLFNCYVMGTIPDSMDGIFDMLKEAALTMQQGGGIGYDFSTIRPKGSPVVKVGSDASGPLSFMDVWDAMCRTVMSAGSRRGAMMATMRCDHPDIEDFIDAKRDAAKLRMFNVSVLVTDAFMDAVAADHEWDLVHEKPPVNAEDRGPQALYIHKTIRARDLWDKIMRSTYDYAEPGVIFIDRINADNNLGYCEAIAATNPCGEQPLPPYGACLLGSINLTRFIREAFDDVAYLNFPALRETVRIAVRMLDNVNDRSRFPLPQQEAEAKAKRRIGLGVTGLADALVMMGIRYGSADAVQMTEKIMEIVAHTAYDASVSLAIEKGPFPAFDADGFLADGTFASRLPNEIKARIREHGIRNSHLLSIAPTGTISLLAGNVSSGIEPIFAPSYERKVLQPDGSKTTERVTDYALSIWEKRASRIPDFEPGEMADLSRSRLPPAMDTVAALTPEAHIRMQAAAQKWVDSSISKTVNLPETISFEHFKAVYRLAYDSGCKGCTTYRPNDVTGSVLSATTGADKPKVTDPPPEPKKALSDALMARPANLAGSTYKIKWPGSEHALYITINNVIEDGHLRPFEIFINSKNMDHFAWTVALTRMVSAVFRRGGDVAFVVEEMKAVFDPRGGAWVDGRYVPSILAAIGGVIEQHLAGIGMDPAAIGDDAELEPVASPPGDPCPKCSSYSTKREAGCLTCLDCGHSKCG